MNQRAGSVLRMPSPLRAGLHRFSLPLLAAGAFALIVVGKADALLVERIRTSVADGLAPLLELVARPSAVIASITERADAIANVYADNERLRRNEARLLHWQATAERLAAENQSLRDLMRVAPDPQLQFISARVISDTGSSFVRTLLTAAGRRHGVRKGQAALTGDGLAGRVLEVGERSSRILLVTDMTSRIPVLIERTRDHAMLAGDNSDFPRLLYLLPDAAPAPGDRIITSGDGGIFPPGLPVGVIQTVDQRGVLVQPFVRLQRVEFLSLVDYELPSILEAAGWAQRGGAAR